MNQEDDFPDEPLPDEPPPIEGEGELVFERSQSSGNAGEVTSMDEPTHEPPLHAPTQARGYGHDDPASLAAVQSTQLAAPDLSVQNQPELPHAQVVSQPEAAAAPAQVNELPEPEKLDLSNVNPFLAHLAQVGLTSSDYWREHIDHRITQLHDEILQVHVQLDVLAKAKPFHKLS